MFLHRLCPAFLVSVALWVQGGCATPALWEAATLESRSAGDVHGISPAPTAAGEPGRRIVVQYGGEHLSDLYVSIPLDAAGAPPASLIYQGKYRTLATIEQDLPPDQRATVASQLFDAASVTDARK